MTADLRLPDRIATPRMILRPAVPGDAPHVFANWASDPEVTRYLTWAPHRGPAEAEATVARAMAGHASGTGEQVRMLCPDDGAPVGMIGLRPGTSALAEGPLEGRGLGPEASIGYVLGRACWGKGLMTEALVALLAAAFAVDPGPIYSFSIDL